ncbi:MAG: serine/threonine-protein kinase [Polyangiaceae bacterium]
MNDLTGTTLKGKFEITGRLGEGAMGTVFRGVDRETGRDVAIKIMHPGLMQEPGMLTRFRREARAMGRVKHPNAVQVVGHGIDKGLVFLAMELIEGLDLAEQMARHGLVEPTRAARIVADVLSALAEAHALGLVHRDVKPENILLGGDGGNTVKLTDFGIAKSALGMSQDSIADEESTEDSCPDSVNLMGGFDLTSAGTLIGSPGYMAPEQWNSRPVDARTDLYACGVMLYQMVTGRLPFEADNPFMVAAMQTRDIPAAPHQRNPRVSRTLSVVILKALKPSPEDRFQSAREMREALLAAADEASVMSNLALDHTLASPTFSPLPAQIQKTEILPNTATPAERIASASVEHGKPRRAWSPEPSTVADKPRPVTASSPAIDELLRTVPRDAMGLPVMHEDGPSSTHLHTPPEIARLSPVPSSSPTDSLARITSVPLAPGAVQLRFLVPLAAAFLALGVVLGILLFFPAN